MEIIKPKIIVISPATVEALRPQKLFFSLQNSTQITISNGLTAALGKAKGVLFGYDSTGVYLWPENRGFAVVHSGSAYHIHSQALVDTLINRVELARRQRYYVTEEINDVGVSKYKVTFSTPLAEWKNRKSKLNDSGYAFENPVAEEVVKALEVKR